MGVLQMIQENVLRNSNTTKVASINAEMEKLIPIVNKLQDVCTQTGTTMQFDLPQIAVIGAQSAGKSSVLENIVGRDFLPRGNGIVTRRPLILQLINAQDEYGEFNHCKDDSNNCLKFSNFDDIRKEIEAETDRETGTNKGISNSPINLRIYSPNVLDLTLIDLPGITKVPVGDQPADIESQIRNMILEFIRKENCLILAVSPANCDLANSDALKLAKEVDKDGYRTIGVITKLDLMDEGTDARDIFEGKLLPLRRGYIGVVNRSQKDIENNKDIADTLEAEHNFFKNHNYYRHIVGRLGTQYLQKVLNLQLTEHIRKTKQSLFEKIKNQMMTLEKDMKQHKELYPEDPSSVKVVMLKIIQKLQADFENEMGSLGSDDVHMDRLSCGAKIRRIFHERLPMEISKIKFDREKLRLEIETAIENLYGMNTVLNTPFKAFELVVKKQITCLEAPIKMCIALVIEELSNAVRNCTRQVFGYPEFRNYVENDIISFIQTNLTSNQQSILSIAEMESAYMNCMNQEFKNDKANPTTDQLLEQVAETQNDLTLDQKKELVHDLSERIDEFKNTNAGGSEDAVLRKGILCLRIDSNKNVKRYWFVLKPKILSAYDEEDHNKLLFPIRLDGLKFRLEKSSGQLMIVLFSSDGGLLPNLQPKMLNLSFTSPSNIHLWAKSLSRLIEQDDKNRLDPLENDVDDAYDKITSYMRIIKKNICDMIPKAITLFIIQKLKKFIKEDLFIDLLEILDEDNLNLFKADEDDSEKFRTMEKMHEMCVKALEIMSEC